MDNFTHGLIGLLAGEVALVARYCGRHRGPPGFRTAVLFCSIAANNTPDIDFLYSAVTGGKLGYLLHHRGHTHTLAGLLPMAALALLPVGLWAWRTRPRWSRRDWALLFGLCLLGPAVHLGMDFLNNYGVQALWPLRNRWVYGDAVFIVEPLLYLAIAPVLAFECRTRTARWVLRLALGVVLGLAWVLPFVAWPWALLLTLLAALLWAAAGRAERRQRVLGALTLFLGVIVLFVGTSQYMLSRVRGVLAQAAPAATTHDVVLTPLPANPLCWSVLAVQTENGDYVVRRAQAALLPTWIPARSCPPRLEDGTTAPLVPVPLVENEELIWDGQFRAPLAELRGLAEDHCGVAAFLRFSRAPFFQSRPGSVIVGDMRYDRDESMGFAEVEFPRPPATCPGAVPNWRRPLADLL